MSESGFGVVEEDAAHGFDGGGVEVGTVGPGDATGADELEIGFVDEDGSRERVAGFFAGEAEFGGLAELLVDEGEELVGGGFAAARSSGEKEGGVRGGGGGGAREEWSQRGDGDGEALALG